MLRSDLLTVINELFRWFSHSYRLFFSSRLTSYSNATVTLDSSFCTRWSQGSLFVLLRCRPTSLPPIASASRNFLSSSFSVLPTLKFLSADASRNGLSSIVLHLLVSPPQRSTACLNKRINVSDYVSSHAAAFNPRANISNMSITVLDVPLIMGLTFVTCLQIYKEIQCRRRELMPY